MQAGWAKDAWAARVASLDLENMMTPLAGRSNRCTGLTFRPARPNTHIHLRHSILCTDKKYPWIWNLLQWTIWLWKYQQWVVLPPCSSKTHSAASPIRLIPCYCVPSKTSTPNLIRVKLASFKKKIGVRHIEKGSKANVARRNQVKPPTK